MTLTKLERRALGRAKGVVRAAGDLGLRLAATSIRLGEVTVLRLRRRSDYRRWTDPSNLMGWWDSRTALLAEMIPAASRVIEFGAGRRQLERYLDPGCAYIPSDLVDRGEGTLVWDLNGRPLPDLRSLGMDVAVFGGVLEYIVDLPALIEWLAKSVEWCVVSYACAATPERYRQVIRDRIRRVGHGYMNHLTEEEIVELFEGRGFSCVRRRAWNEQCLFVFHRETARSTARRTGAS